ncbi:MAG: lysostaphin resistance A-like protein [Mycobacterium sp.]
MDRADHLRGTGSPTGRVVLIVGIAVYLAAILFVAIGNGGQIRYSADTDDTIPVWQTWVPVLIGIALTFLFSRPAAPAEDEPTANVRTEAVVLLALAVAFTVLLTMLGPAEPRYLALKLGVLVIGPLALFAFLRRRRVRPGRHSWRPLIPAAGWAIGHLALSSTRPDEAVAGDLTTAIAILAVGFLVNAVVEEFFYRRWLQTAWTRAFGGPWPAIVLSSIVWASWHIAIQGTGALADDLANVIANQGILGLFLGLMWSRYRVMWPLLVVHGLLNANPLLFL